MFLAAAWLAVALSQADAAAVAPAVTPLGRACVAPVAPPSIRPALGPAPKLPSCVNEAKGTHTCRKGEIERYNAGMKSRNNAMDTFIGEVNAYTGLLNQYTLAANEYARCELREVRRADD